MLHTSWTVNGRRFLDRGFLEGFFFGKLDGGWWTEVGRTLISGGWTGRKLDASWAIVFWTEIFWSGFFGRTGPDGAEIELGRRRLSAEVKRRYE